MKTYSLGTLLTFYTGRMLTTFDEVYDFAEYMTGEPQMTHQIPRVMDECKAPLGAQFPFLADIEVPADLPGGGVEWLNWVAGQAEVYGNQFEVQPLAEGDHTHINPLVELAMKAPHLQIIPVVLSEGEPS